VRTVEELSGVHAALHPRVRSLAPSGRVLVLGAPLDPADPHQSAVQQGLEGFVRSLGKEIGGGRTVTLLRLTDPAAAESTLRFLLSPKSAYVDGQVIEVGEPEEADTDAEVDWDRPLAGRTALVTGAARGIGEALVRTLARDGARVVCLDVPAAGPDLDRVAASVGGAPLALDITAPDAAARIGAALPDGLDVLVHNAGITRDRRLANMSADRWNAVLDVNLGSVPRTTDALLGDGVLRRGGRVVATASISGIAGNTGQTNYATSKAGIVGMVRALAPVARAAHGVTVNAVAPGFIETAMTAAVPLLIREAGRRMTSLGQGGLPQDVAETTAWLAHPASGAVNGQVVRVCGQSLLGA
jgi:3-oxoacyl-[acyl-carrier protein] reductase